MCMRWNWLAAPAQPTELLVVPLSSEAAELTIEQGWFAPRYGERHAAPRLRVNQQGTSSWYSTLLIPSGRNGRYRLCLRRQPNPRPVW